MYYANYLKYLEEGRTIFFQDKGISIQKLHNEGFLYAVRKCNVTYKAPARYGDEIICKLKELIAILEKKKNEKECDNSFSFDQFTTREI